MFLFLFSSFFTLLVLCLLEGVFFRSPFCSDIACSTILLNTCGFPICDIALS